MAKVYADLIRKGLKTIDDVPDKLKATVQAILDKTENGGDN
ncbi:CD1375 family protein [Sporofaciens sp. SGI.106]